MRVFLTSLIAVLALGMLAEAQSRRPTTARQVQPQTVREVTITQCRPSDYIRMTRGGMAFLCEMNIDGEFQNAILAFDGGTQPGGISAAMTLLTNWRDNKNQGQHILVWYRDPDAAHTSICNTVRTPSDQSAPCRELVSFSG